MSLRAPSESELRADPGEGLQWGRCKQVCAGVSGVSGVWAPAGLPLGLWRRSRVSGFTSRFARRPERVNRRALHLPLMTRTGEGCRCGRPDASAEREDLSLAVLCLYAKGKVWLFFSCSSQVRLSLWEDLSLVVLCLFPKGKV